MLIIVQGKICTKLNHQEDSYNSRRGEEKRGRDMDRDKERERESACVNDVLYIPELPQDWVGLYLALSPANGLGTRLGYTLAKPTLKPQTSSFTV